jgi:hypothetical protein
MWDNPYMIGTPAGRLIMDVLEKWAQFDDNTNLQGSACPGERMKITGCIPQAKFEYEVKSTSLRIAVNQFQSDYPDAEITLVDGKEVVDICESCDLPILDGEQYWHDSDGIFWHVVCPEPE